MPVGHRILLVNADYPGSHYDWLNVPVGLGYISETLSKNRIEHEVFDLGLGGGYKKLKRLISSYRPGLIGYSFMSFRYRHNYSILEALKRDFSKVKIIAGGPHISSFKEKALLDCQAIDIGVAMEGEDTLFEICTKKPLDEIAGIFYRRDRDIVQTRPRDLVDGLDRIPFPRYEKFNINNYPKIIPIVTSRGCPYQCIFCPVGSVMGKRFRSRSAGSIADEIEFWYKRGFRDFSIADDVFNLIEKRVYDMCDEIEKRRLSGLRIRCSNGIRADRTDSRLLTRMKEVGFYHLAFGVESASNRVLETIKKGEKIEEIGEAISEACRLGFCVELFFLVGSPSETWADVQESIRFALRYPICGARFYNLIPFPYTELYKWIEERDYFLFPQPEYLNDIMHHVNMPLFTTPELTLQERKRAFRYANAVIDKHTKRRRSRFEKWLIKEKLQDYYSVKGIWAEVITWLYHKRWCGRLLNFFVFSFTKIKKKMISLGSE
jgi:radical SAM superfamily enzyme YgiQ (UPF0313 family)